MKRTKKYLLILSLFFFLSEISSACSVCKGGASQAKSDAYILTTGILGALPLLLGTIFCIFIRRAYKGNREFQELK